MRLRVAPRLQPLSRALGCAAIVWASSLPSTAAATTFELRQSGWVFPPGTPSATGIAAGDLLVSGPLNQGFGIGSTTFSNRGLVSLLSHTEGGGLFINGTGVFENVFFLESGYTDIQGNGVLLNLASGTLTTNEIDTGRLGGLAGLRTLTVSAGSGLESAISLQVGAAAGLENYGTWRDRGSSVVNGRVLNAGTFLSANNPALVLPSPRSLPYKQEIRIEHWFNGEVGPAQWLNTLPGSILTVGANTTLSNRGEFLNAGTVRVLGTFNNLPSKPLAYDKPASWGSGRFENVLNGFAGHVIVENLGKFWTGDSTSEDFVNQGRITVGRNGFVDGENVTVNQGGAAQITIEAGAFSTPFLRNGGSIQLLDYGRIEFTEFEQEANGVTTLSRRGVILPRSGTSSRLVNYGTVQIDLGSILITQNFDQQGGLLIVNGALNVPGELRHAGGDILGGGMINGDTFTGGGVGIARWKPGSSPGTLTVNGYMTFDFNSVVELEVELDAQGGLAWDHLIANGMTFLAGSKIKLLLGPGTEQFVGESKEMLTCTLAACDFSLATLEVTGGAGANATFGPQGLTIALAPVPEPEAWTLLLAGLGTIAWVARRRRGVGQRRSPWFAGAR